MKAAKTDKRESIIAAAYALFEEHGFHATGVDSIAAAAQTTKRTLYRLFGSKENLALEVIRRHDTDFRAKLRQTLQATATEAHERILAIFDEYGTWFESASFRGCFFIKAIIEFQTSSPSLRKAAGESKELLRLYVERLCRDLGAKNPELLSYQLQILLEGSIIAAQANQSRQPAATAREMARSLLAQATAD